MSPASSGNERRHDRALESPGRDNHIVGLDQPVGGFHGEAGPADVPLHFRDLHAAADGGGDFFCIGDEIVRDLLLVNESIGGVRKLHPRKAVVPGRTISNQGVPSFRAPAFGNAVPLKDEMRDAALAEMLAHSHSGLTSTNNKRIYFLD